MEELQEQYIQEAEKSSTLQKKLSEMENKLTEMQGYYTLFHKFIQNTEPRYKDALFYKNIIKFLFF